MKLGRGVQSQAQLTRLGKEASRATHLKSMNNDLQEEYKGAAAVYGDAIVCDSRVSTTSGAPSPKEDIRPSSRAESVIPSRAWRTGARSSQGSMWSMRTESSSWCEMTISQRTASPAASSRAARAAKA